MFVVSVSRPCCFEEEKEFFCFIKRLKNISLSSDMTI